MPNIFVLIKLIPKRLQKNGRSEFPIYFYSSEILNGFRIFFASITFRLVQPRLGTYEHVLSLATSHKC